MYACRAAHVPIALDALWALRRAPAASRTPGEMSRVLAAPPSRAPPPRMHMQAANMAIPLLGGFGVGYLTKDEIPNWWVAPGGRSGRCCGAAQGCA